MAEHPILFNTEMVRAILDGRKTMTRRVIKPQPVFIEESGRWRWPVTGAVTASLEWFHYMDSLDRCPYGQPSDRLWVRETWCRGRDALVYRVDHPEYKSAPSHDNKWRPSIHMPRWASRITLEVTSVRVERVQDISSDDAQAEGVNPWFPSYDVYPGAMADYIARGGSYRNGFHELWDKINKKRGYSWHSNPWVWVVEFKVI